MNGESLGKKTKDLTKFPASGLTWTVNFKEGNNTLKAIGKDDSGNTITDEMSVNYRFEKNGKARELVLDHNKLANGNYLFTATAIDEKGMRCLDYEDRVYFQCLAGGTTMKSMGTPTGSESIKMANGKASIEVQPDSDDSTKLQMMVLNQSFKGTYVTID